MSGMKQTRSPWLKLEGEILHCPVCDFECTHLSAVTVHENTRSVSIEPDDQIFIDHHEPSHARGSTIDVRCYCESHHWFVIRIAFHKGTIRVHPIIGEDIPHDEYPPPELWRD